MPVKRARDGLCASLGRDPPHEREASNSGSSHQVARARLAGYTCSGREGAFWLPSVIDGRSQPNQNGTVIESQFSGIKRRDALAYGQPPGR